VVAVAAWLGAAGCAKREQEADDPNAPPPMEAEEQQRASTACEAYAERVCRCAEAQPALAQECELARGRPDALATTLELVNAAAGVTKKERRAAQAAARQIAGACFEADNRLDPASCPRAQAR
jgi:hypothetical protein